MKTIIDDNKKAMIIAEYFERPVRADGADHTTEYVDFFKWVAKDQRLAHGINEIRSLSIFFSDENRPNKIKRVDLDLYQIKQIVNYFNNIHEKPTDEPVEVDIDDYPN